MNRQNCVMICMSLFRIKVTMFKIICHCPLYDFLTLRCDHRSCNRNLRMEILAQKTSIRASTGFEPMDSALY